MITARLIFVLGLLSVVICDPDQDKYAHCTTWAIRRIVGADDVHISDVMNSTSASKPVQIQQGINTGPTAIVGNRPGKMGPIGPPGERGPIGAPGVCDCIPDELKSLQRENELLKEQLDRVRKTSPETFCLLGMKDGSIPDDAIFVSSVPGRKIYGRLDNTVETWHPNANNPGNDWIMADLGKSRLVTGVVTQGRQSADQWTTSYKVEHSKDGFNFTDVKKSDRSELVFRGNTDRSTKVVNRFPEPVVTRFIRIYPVTYNDWIMVRFDMIDC